MIVAIDFDGTIVTHEYPHIGTPVPGAIDAIKAMQAAGAKIILWTMRSGDTLSEALGYLESEGIDVWGANKNPEQDWSTSPKAYAHRYIDDAAVGCPLVRPNNGGRPFVDWYALDLPLVGRVVRRGSGTGSGT
jgi:ribonucleotide monophosphatase NagD (HAD superfamily)